VKHQAATVTPSELAQLIIDIDSNNSGSFCTREALKLIPRIFLRPKEIRHLRWEYIDFEAKLIRTPEQEMKRQREHLVPLAGQVVHQLQEIKKVTGYSVMIGVSVSAGDSTYTSSAAGSPVGKFPSE
jgi:integrase